MHERRVAPAGHAPLCLTRGCAGLTASTATLEPMIPLVPRPGPLSEHTAIDVPTAMLAQYVGVYALERAPDFNLTVTQQNGAPFAQATGQQKFRVFPESETKVFYKVVDAQITFTLAADGQPAYLTLHQGGADQRATKVS